VIYEVWTVTRPERWILRRLEAKLVPKGEHLAAKMALKDMAVASGLTVAPSMHLLETPNVNAFAFKAPGRRPVLGVTSGLLERLSVDEQRAVFANLTARVISGDTLVSSVVASLLSPLNRFRDYRLTALDAEDRLMSDALEARKHSSGESSRGGGLPASALFILVLFPLVLAGEIVAAAQRRSHLVAAEKADAEGMLLLKDPRPMLSALERCIRLNNNVSLADETLGDLFYCWTGDSTDDECDPEWRRVARLREVLGVDGWVPDEPDASCVDDLLPPPAPRLEK
jgi:Zn-dependent protease with chaperone function